MKHHQRLDYSRLAEVLHERGVANVDAIRELLQQSREGGMPFCEALVTTNLVPDWDLSRIVCETFSLPFLPVDMVEPSEKVRTEVDIKLFRSHQIVPIDRFGQVLTVIMPALVPADVLALVAAASDLVVLPLVGTVETNRRWILEHLGSAKTADIEGGWSNLFDQADAEVTAALDGPEAGPVSAPGFDFGAPELAPPETTAETTSDGLDEFPANFAVDDIDFGLASTAAVHGDDESLDLGVLATQGDEGVLETEALDEDVADEPVDEFDVVADEEEAPPRPKASSGGFELPPMPEFGGGRQAG